MQRTLVFFLTQFLLWVLVSQVNHELTPWGISLFMGGLFVGFSALHFERREALIGGFAAWIAQGKHRRTARRSRREAESLRAETQALRSAVPDSALPALTSPRH